MSKTKDTDAIERENRKNRFCQVRHRISTLMKEHSYTDKTLAEAVGISVDMERKNKHNGK